MTRKTHLPDGKHHTSEKKAHSSGPDSSHAPYIDRDVSWMYFNRRILLEAKRSDVPLLERLAFMGIYSNNLDEFFRVRMATISRIAETSDRAITEQRQRARDLYKHLSDIDSEYSKEYAATMHELIGLLADEGIVFVNETQLTEEQQHFVRCLFRKKVSGFVSPVWLDRVDELARENDDHIHLAISLKDASGKEDYALIRLPSDKVGRFIVLPEHDGKKYVMYLDDLIRFALPMIFTGMGFETFEAYSFKFTKDAEMEIDNDLRMGTLQKVSQAVKSRRKGATLRVIYDARMPRPLLKAIMRKLKLTKLDTVMPSGRYHNHKDLMSFPDMGRPDLKYERWLPAIPSELKGRESLLGLIAAKDRFVQVPYQSFDYVVRLLQEAAVSKNVKSIKITLYRVARDSKIIEALICAARNGKKVTAVVELLARFDESSNISWSKKMQEAGINVIFGVDGLKVHSKIIHIGMKKRRNIALIGTGNFHEGNAKVYTDYFMMTANPEITRDVDAVFDFIKKPYHPVRFRHLLVSPNEMRCRFTELIDEEIHAARHGHEAWIRIKINHITDEEMVKKLYEASRAGVDIRICVRGNCSLVTGEKGYSENIKADGIIDRYLEHSRLFVFCARGKHKTFLGSADWMPRNLDHRIEVITPVLDRDIKADVLNTIETGLRDNTHTFVVDGTGSGERWKGDSPVPVRSQQVLHDRYTASASPQP